MANEKTPLLQSTFKAEVVVKITDDKPVDCDINNNEITTSLTYEELLPFIIDPSWIHLRKICSTTCLIAFIVIFLAACISAHTSMTKMSCNVLSPMILAEGDNDSLLVDTKASKGILSVIIDGFNSTVST